MEKSNNKLSVILLWTGFIFSLAGLIMFKLFPSSDFANSVEHSAKDGLMVFIVTPVLLLLGAAAFITALLKNAATFEKLISHKGLYAATGIFGVGLIFNFAVALAYLISQFSLGFLAPFEGTVYDKLFVIMAVVTALEAAFSVFATIKISK